jgi:hypothetical protein
VTSEPLRGTAVATGSRQEAAAAAVATAAATAASAVPPVPVPTTGDQATVVEIPNDDAPPPEWGQWENWPAPAPEPTAGVLLMREDGCVVPRHPTHDTEASSSRAGLLTQMSLLRTRSRSKGTPARHQPTLTRP